MSKSPILRFPIPFDEEFTEKGYWPFAVVELPDGLYYSVYFAQICSIDCNPYFAPPGLIIVPEVTIKSMETTIHAFLPTRWDMPCRINLSRILSRRYLIRRIAWPYNHE